MTTGTEIMRRAGILLNDEGFERWTPAELCEWINDGLKAIVLVKPSAKSGTRVLHLQRGTHQVIEAVADAPAPIALLNIIRNITAEGPPRVAGRTIKITSGVQLDAANPDWHMDKGLTRFRKEVRHFVYDEQNPLEFYVYPGNDGTGMVEALCGEIPTLLAKTAPEDGSSIEHYGADIDLPEVYDPPLVDYVCFRAQSKDATEAAGGRASAHQLNFANALGIKIQVEGASSANSRRGGA